MKNRSNISGLEHLAASQWGMFTVAQAQILGFRRNQISRMVDAARVESMCYGVYRFVAGSEPVHADLKAAWLSVFPKETAAERLSKRPYDAVVASGTASVALGAGDFHMSPYTFIASSRRQTARADMRFLMCSLEDCDVVMLDGLPTTTPERTVFDLLRLDEDPSLVDGFMREVVQNRAHSFDFERLASLLGPIASRYGFPKGGAAFAADLVSRNAADVLMCRAGAELKGVLNGISDSDALEPETKKAGRYLFDALRDLGLDFEAEEMRETPSERNSTLAGEGS